MNVRLDLAEMEFLWCLCYAVTLAQIATHMEHLRIAQTLEPFLYKQIKEMVPEWESPLKQSLN